MIILYGSIDQPRPHNYNFEINLKCRSDILEGIDTNPKSSIRQTDNKRNTSKAKVHRAVEQNKYHPYDPAVVQAMIPNDYQ